MTQPGAPWRFPHDWQARDGAVVGALALLWLAIGWIVGLAGDFPLNDDFSYALSARWLAEDGEFHRSPWTYVPAVPHILLGALALKGFPASFLALRVTGFVLTGLCVLLTYPLSRQLGASRGMASVASLAFGLNPITVYLGFTFMTEPSFLAFLLAGSIAGLERLRGGGAVSLALTVLFCTLAVATRDPGFALPIAFAFATVAAAPRRPRTWISGALPLAASAFTDFAIRTWLFSPTGSQLGLETIVFLAGSGHALYAVVYNTLGVFSYLGLFLLPLALLGWGRPELPPRPGWFALASAGLVTAGFVLTGIQGLPLVNLIGDLRVGPVDVPGEEAMPALGAPVLLATAWIGGVVGLLVAAGYAWHQLRPTVGDPARLYLLGFAAIFLGPHLLRIPLFDRYLLMVLPALAAVLLAATPVRRSGRARTAVVAFLLVVAAVYGTAGTRDMMERHRAIDRLIHRGTTSLQPDEIRGGFAHRGWHQFDRAPQVPRHRNWWMTWARAEVHYGEVVGALDRISLRRWMPPGQESYSLVALPEPEADPEGRDGGADGAEPTEATRSDPRPRDE